MGVRRATDLGRVGGPPKNGQVGGTARGPARRAMAQGGADGATAVGRRRGGDWGRATGLAGVQQGMWAAGERGRSGVVRGWAVAHAKASRAEGEDIRIGRF